MKKRWLRSVVGSRAFGLLVACLLPICGGCTPAVDSATSSTAAAPSSSNVSGGAGLPAAQRDWEAADPGARTEGLWRAVRQHYATLPRYRDRATVQLQYELTGNRMFESMPCAVVFDRATQRWQGQLFRTLLEGDPRGWMLRIREAATRDFDQQVKQVAADRDWRVVASEDAVAAIYLSGATDLPLGERTQAGMVLALPQLAWLWSADTEGTIDRSGPPSTRDGRKEWETQYLGWTWYRQQFCVKFSTKWRGATVELWVDPQALLVRRMELPIAVLNSDLAEAAEVRNVQFAIDFADIDVGEAVTVPAPSPLGPGERLVKHFVKIPESFPSPWVGRLTRPLLLRTHQRMAYRLPALKGGLTVALFLPQVDASSAWWGCLQAAAARHSSDSFCLVLDAIEPPVPVNSVVATPVVQPAAGGDLEQDASPALDDRVAIVPYGAEAWQAWGLNQGRWLVVWDAAGTMQYAGAIEQETLPAIVDTVVHRVARGDAVGQEMIAEYQAFLTEYWAQLERQNSGTP